MCFRVDRPPGRSAGGSMRFLRDSVRYRRTLSGMAAVLETRWRHAQIEKLTPIGLVSMLVADELLRRPDRLLERRHKQGRFRDPDRSLDTFDFDFKQEDESGADPRARDRALHRATGGCALS